MGILLALVSKELAGFFKTPIAYIVISLFIGLSGYFFTFNIVFVHTVHMITAFHNMSLLLLLLMPLLTMRSFSEEIRSGTLEVLLSLPLREWQIVISKYISYLVILLLMLLGSSSGILPLLFYGEPDIGPVIGGYIGVFMLGATFIAIGEFCSTLTENQVLAATISWFIIILLWFIDYMGSIVEGGMSLIFHKLSFSVLYIDLIRGVIDTSSVTYFITIISFMLYMSYRSVVWRKRW